MAPRKQTITHNDIPSKGRTNKPPRARSPPQPSIDSMLQKALTPPNLQVSHQCPTAIIRRSDPSDAYWHEGVNEGATSTIKSQPGASGPRPWENVPWARSIETAQWPAPGVDHDPTLSGAEDYCSWQDSKGHTTIQWCSFRKYLEELILQGFFK